MRIVPTWNPQKGGYPPDLGARVAAIYVLNP